MFQIRNLCQPRPAIQRFCIRPLNQASENADLAFLQPDLVLHFALADDGLLNPADRGGTCYGRHFDAYLHADFAIGVHARSNFNNYPHINILELGIH